MKLVKEINLILKNEQGLLSSLCEILDSHGIGIIGFYAMLEGDYARISFVTNDHDKAINVLSTKGYQANERQVIACEMPEHFGGLNAILKPLRLSKIDIEQIYPCIGIKNMTVLIICVKPIEQALKILEEHWVRIFGNEVYHLR